MAQVDFIVKNPSLGEEQALCISVGEHETLLNIKSLIGDRFPGNPRPDQITVGAGQEANRLCRGIAGEACR